MSILLWKFDRQLMYSRFDLWVKKIIHNKIIIEILYLVIIGGVCLILEKIKYIPIYNFITAFIVIDISNSERKNLQKVDRRHFYNTISLISRSLVSGFIAPLIYILVLGNYAGIIYSIVFNLSMDEEYTIVKLINSILTIIPSIIVQIVLYLIYLCRNKCIKIEFGGDYISNMIYFPLLNVDILAAYVESVNFYFYYSDDNMDYLKSYGKYSNKIDNVSIKDYLSISYAICFVYFIIFFIIVSK